MNQSAAAKIGNFYSASA